MINLDYLTLLCYIIGLFVIGGLFSRKIKDSTQMFAAGRQSPWWVSGLSGFMTIFSAGTFVVWGGIAFRLGAVAISILICCGGFSSLMVGYFIAGRWRKLGITTPAEYVNLRFGKTALYFLTWCNAVGSAIAMSVGLYSLSVILAALIKLSPNHMLADPEIGNLSVTWATIICGTIIIIYTTCGGLWAVLMTDVVQSIILSATVAIIVPLCFIRIGGVQNFFKQSPKGFFSPVGGEFTYLFLFLWTFINFMRWGGLWSFIQRYICVPSPKDARRVAYLMGVLFLICPFIWMLPAMIYRQIDPNANPEQAYILACQHVLPAGLLGMVLATMFSATASMMSSELNVYAGSFTRDIYRPMLCPNASEKHLVLVGRIATLLYGLSIIGGALVIPLLGGAEQVVLPFMMLLSGPLVFPVIWGLFSKKINHRSVWATVLVTVIIGGFMKFGLATGLIASQISLSIWVQENLRLAEASVGLIVPLAVLGIMELLAKGTDSGAIEISEAGQVEIQQQTLVKASKLPAKIVACTVGFLGFTMAIVTLMANQQRIVVAIFAAMLLLIAGIIAWFAYRPDVSEQNTEVGIQKSE